ncbi:hypothetical protein DV735_g3362, partial [Chaetothyriales sp. CBS 134920]
MASFPRRSARLTVSTSNLPSPATTNQPFNSPPPIAFRQHNAAAAETAAMSGLQLPPSFPHQHDSARAPLPSPSTAKLDPFASRPQSQSNYPPSQPPHQEQTMNHMFGQQPQSLNHNHHGHNQSQNPPHLHPHSNSIDHGQGNMLSLNPGQLPPDFLAEAARRAQIACLMRDMGDVSL